MADTNTYATTADDEVETGLSNTVYPAEQMLIDPIPFEEMGPVPTPEYSDAELSPDDNSQSGAASDDEHGSAAFSVDEDLAAIDHIAVGTLQNAARVLGTTFKGLGKGKGKRFRGQPKPKGTQNVTKGDLRRLARRGGVVRMSGLCDEPVRDALKVFLTQIIADSVIYTEHARRKTVTNMDIMYSLKKNGRPLYN